MNLSSSPAVTLIRSMAFLITGGLLLLPPEDGCRVEIVSKQEPKNLSWTFLISTLLPRIRDNFSLGVLSGLTNLLNKASISLLGHVCWMSELLVHAKTNGGLETRLTRMLSALVSPKTWRMMSNN